MTESTVKEVDQSKKEEGQAIQSQNIAKNDLPSQPCQSAHSPIKDIQPGEDEFTFNSKINSSQPSIRTPPTDELINAQPSVQEETKAQQSPPKQEETQQPITETSESKLVAELHSANVPPLPVGQNTVSPLTTLDNDLNLPLQSDEKRKEFSQSPILNGSDINKSQNQMDYGSSLNTKKILSGNKYQSALTVNSPARQYLRQSNKGLNRTTISQLSNMSCRSPAVGAKRSPLKNRISVKQNVSQEEMNCMKELFDLLDYEHRGIINPEEFIHLMEAMRILMTRY